MPGAWRSRHSAPIPRCTSAAVPGAPPQTRPLCCAHVGVVAVETRSSHICGAGQVYRGRLRSTGEEVAVKVQRPGIGDTIALDMVLLRRLMSAVDANMPQLGRYQVPRAALPPGLMRTAGGALSGPERPTMQPEEQIWVGTSWLGSRADHRCRCAGTCISCYAFLRCLATSVVWQDTTAPGCTGQRRRAAS